MTAPFDIAAAREHLSARKLLVAAPAEIETEELLASALDAIAARDAEIERLRILADSDERILARCNAAEDERDRLRPEVTRLLGLLDAKERELTTVMLARPLTVTLQNAIADRDRLTRELAEAREKFERDYGSVIDERDQFRRERDEFESRLLQLSAEMTERLGELAAAQVARAALCQRASETLDAVTRDPRVRVAIDATKPAPSSAGERVYTEDERDAIEAYQRWLFDEARGPKTDQVERGEHLRMSSRWGENWKASKEGA